MKSRAVRAVAFVMSSGRWRAGADEDGAGLGVSQIEWVGPRGGKSWGTVRIKRVVQVFLTIAGGFDNDDAADGGGVEDGGKNIGPEFHGNIAGLIAARGKVVARAGGVELDKDDV